MEARAETASLAIQLDRRAYVRFPPKADIPCSSQTKWRKSGI